MSLSPPAQPPRTHPSSPCSPGLGTQSSAPSPSTAGPAPSSGLSTAGADEWAQAPLLSQPRAWGARSRALIVQSGSLRRAWGVASAVPSPSVFRTLSGGREPLCGPSGPSGENDPGRQGCGHPHLGWREVTPGVRSRVCPFLPCSPEGSEGPGFCEGSAQSPFMQIRGKMTS